MAIDRLINSTQGDTIISKLDDIKTAINNQSTAATETPLMDGTATVGTSTKYARENHVHPTDTSRAANVMSTYAVDTTRENITTSSTVQEAIEQLEYREELNKNNILSIYDTGYAQKNVMHIVLDEVKALLPSQLFVGNTTTFGNLSVTFNEDNSITLNGSHTAAVAINFKDLSHINMPTNAVGAASANITLSNDIFFGLWGNSGVSNLVLNDGVDIPSDYASNYSRGFVIRVSANTVCNNVRIYPMVCDKALYQASSEVVPYALSNTVITPALKECVDNGKKNYSSITGLSKDTTTAGFASETNFGAIIPAGTYVVSYDLTRSDNTKTGVIGFRDVDEAYTDTGYYWTTASHQIQTVTFSKAVKAINMYVAAGTTCTMSNLMIQTIASYNAGCTTYQPYALSNSELTSRIMPYSDYEQIANNTNLNNLTTVGKRYQCNSAAIAATLTNCPTTDGFMMMNKETASVLRFIQEIIPNKDNEIYRRWYTSTGFGSWYKFTGAQVQ